VPKKPASTEPLKAVTPPRKKSVAEEMLTREKQFLSLARARFKQAEEAERETRKLCLDDLKFSLGEQWSDTIRTARVSEDMPCLTINRIAGMLRIICNEQRAQRQAIQVDPIGSGADVKTAEVIQGYIRHIEQRSDADTIYDMTFEQMARSGIGWTRVLTEYADEDSLDLDICIEHVKNAFAVYSDPGAKKADKSDMDWLFFIENLKKDEYCGEYPDSQLASLTDWQSEGDRAPGWLSHDSVRIAEYFYVEKEAYKLARLSDGSSVPENEIPRGQAKSAQIVERFRRKVKWSRINGIEALAKKDWPGKYIPFVPDIADDFDVDGKQYLAGAVRTPKDAQRAYNYWITYGSEKIALRTKASWLIASGQQEGFTKMWERTNTSRVPLLIYKPVKIGDTVLPPPREIDSEPAMQGVAEMIHQADNDLKATFGIYDASLGQQGPQESGEAILARQKQTDVAILNYTDNHARYLRGLGKIEVDLIPKIVTSPRMKRIINPDGTTAHVGIYNSEFDTEEEAKERLADIAADDAAIKRIYDVGVGDYDISIESGDSYQTKRKESAVAMMKMVDAYPQLMQAAADLIIKNMDWPGSEEIADRLRKMIPPQLLGDPQGDPKQMLQNTQAQLQAMMQSHAAVVKELNAATEIIRTKKLELDQKREASMLQAQVALLVQQAKSEGEAGLAALKAQLGTVSHFMEQVHAKMFQDEQEAEQPPIPATQVTPPNQPKPDLSQGLLPPQQQQPGQ
jgi:hypothetical protein